MIKIWETRTHERTFFKKIHYLDEFLKLKTHFNLHLLFRKHLSIILEWRHKDPQRPHSREAVFAVLLLGNASWEILRHPTWRLRMWPVNGCFGNGEPEMECHDREQVQRLLSLPMCPHLPFQLREVKCAAQVSDTRNLHRGTREQRKSQSIWGWLVCSNQSIKYRRGENKGRMPGFAEWWEKE